MEFRYGDFSKGQMQATKEKMRKHIFFLLLIVDPKTAHDYEYVNVEEAFENVLTMFGSLNDLLSHPKEMVDVIGLINAAYLEYRSPEFKWEKYRRLILNAGCTVVKIEEV